MQPFVCFELQVGATFFAVLVAPVRRDALLRHMVHAFGADLYLNRRPVGADQGGVQRLVAVALGNGDVILELAGHRLVQRVQRAEGEITGRDVAHDDAKTVDIEHLRKAEMLFGHFAINRIQTFLATKDLCVDAGLVHFAAYTIKDAREEFAPIAARGLQCPRQHARTQGVDVRKGKILQLAEKFVQPKPVGDRRVDFQRFVGDASSLFGANGRHGLQVVQAVGQFDQNNAQIARHRHQHLAKILGLRFLVRLEFYLVEFGQAVDQLGDGFAESTGNLGLAHRRVFHDVVQQGRNHRLHVHAPLGHGAGYG